MATVSNNDELKRYAKEKGVRFWEIADKIGINDGNFSRLLRKEFSDEKKAEIMNIIDIIALGAQFG